MKRLASVMGGHALGLLLCLSLLLGSTVGRSANPDKTLLVFGDSLSAAYGLTGEQKGWVKLLEDKLKGYAPRWQVKNISLSGETTSGGLARLPGALERYKPDLVLLQLGANDGFRGTPLTVVRNNFDQMLRMAQRQKIAVVLFEMKIPPNYGPAYTKGFNQIYHDLAREFSVQLLPFFLDGVAGLKHRNQPDGIHPTAEAQPILLNNSWPTLAPFFQNNPPTSNSR